MRITNPQPWVKSTLDLTAYKVNAEGVKIQKVSGVAEGEGAKIDKIVVGSEYYYENNFE